ncbi:hypothetical protein K504DRAFT_489547 [Pleomassaria siparia CBS 279.74]|uniref:Vacuolar protein sorting-associated protein 62 n=1 Tax=Pleomassaria siparia CBS 279.74 TaxID=1314801 RepID=A0A6G1KFY4_9PLEO|nr:hypothetical protein K504DRAFT_489547 [Pleomassaria siparia CBS 279.74]
MPYRIRKCLSMADTAKPRAQAPSILTAVPQYVLDHAPLLYLSSKDPYRPSSLSTHLAHTTPKTGFIDEPIPSPPLTLHNLDQLNNTSSQGADVYLTSVDDVTTNPKWLEGVVVDEGGGIGDEGEGKTGVTIVVEKGMGKEGKVVDVFYFYFFSFNWGGVVLGNQLGDHVGDWEHNMIRFINGVPKYVWYSQHANGEAFTFEALKKDQTGKRPLVFVANGSHALYPTPGTHDHTLPNLNLPFPLLLVDETDTGPLYDPLLSTLSYTYIVPQPTPTIKHTFPVVVETSSSASVWASSSPFNPYNADDPVAFLEYRGRWGDAEYPAGDKRQKDLAGNKKYVGGPTGPWDKGLDRRQVWPENSFSKGQRIRKSLDVGGGWGALKAWRCFANKGSNVVRVNVSGEEIE